MVGFDARNEQNIHEQYHCKICSLVLREPLQLNCGHRHCRSCIELKIEGEILKCPQCNEESNQKEAIIDKAYMREMESLTIECSLCAWKNAHKNYQDHLVKSHPNPSCQYCGKKFESTNQLNLHKLNDCDKITVPCILKNYGCSDSIPRVELSQHYLSEEHQCALVAFIRRHLSKVIIDQPEERVEMDVGNRPHTTTSLSGDTNAQLKGDETPNVLVGELHALSEAVHGFGDESIHYQNISEILTKDFVKLKPSIQEQNAFLGVRKRIREILSQEVASIKQKLEVSKHVSTDGTLTWRIPNVAEKMADAQSKRQTSIYSPPFYSSPTGYKMIGRLHFLVSRAIRRPYMLLFIILMAGANNWTWESPTNYKAGFCVYNQTPAQRHLIDYFQRIESPRNIASGIPKFSALIQFNQEINPYVKDNTMFIKIMVDFSDMPKTLLPYSLSLNPGLPNNVQRQLIKQEIERRAQHTVFPGGNWEPNQKLAFLCEMCFLTAQHSDRRFCDHCPKQRWINTQNDRVVRSGRCEEWSINTQNETNEMLSVQRVDLESSNANDIYSAYQPTEIIKYKLI